MKRLGKVLANIEGVRRDCDRDGRQFCNQVVEGGGDLVACFFARPVSDVAQMQGGSLRHLGQKTIAPLDLAAQNGHPCRGHDDFRPWCLFLTQSRHRLTDVREHLVFLCHDHWLGNERRSPVLT